MQNQDVIRQDAKCPKSTQNTSNTLHLLTTMMGQSGTMMEKSTSPPALATVQIQDYSIRDYNYFAFEPTQPTQADYDRFNEPLLNAATVHSDER